MVDCLKKIAEVIAEDSGSDLQKSKYRILRYLDFQLARAACFIEADVDLMAAVMRNLIELRFWAKFVVESSENATQFLNEHDIDTKELAELLMKIPGEGSSWSEMPSIEGKRVKVQQCGDMEKWTWKLCSKLIHPSSFMINQFDHRLRDPVILRILALQVVQYGLEIVSIFNHAASELAPGNLNEP